MSSPLSIINETGTKIPSSLPFSDIKDAILGKEYTLNLIITTSDQIQKLNLQYRNKNVPTDILSFPLSDTEGEIYISPNEAKEEAVKFDREYENFLGFLFIHGCTHLKGHDHGSTMESIEAKVRKEFGI